MGYYSGVFCFPQGLCCKHIAAACFPLCSTSAAALSLCLCSLSQRKRRCSLTSTKGQKERYFCHPAACCSSCMYSNHLVRHNNRPLKSVHLILPPVVEHNVRNPPQGSRSGQTVNFIFFHIASHTTPPAPQTPALHQSFWVSCRAFPQLKALPAPVSEHICVPRGFIVAVLGVGPARCLSIFSCLHVSVCIMCTCPCDCVFACQRVCLNLGV